MRLLALPVGGPAGREPEPAPAPLDLGHEGLGVDVVAEVVGDVVDQGAEVGRALARRVAAGAGQRPAQPAVAEALDLGRREPDLLLGAPQRPVVAEDALDPPLLGVGAAARRTAASRPSAAAAAAAPSSSSSTSRRRRSATRDGRESVRPSSVNSRCSAGAGSGTPAESVGATRGSTRSR